MEAIRLAGSFRDPAGCVFLHEGLIHRQVNPAGQADFELLIQSGLYDALTRQGLLIPHEDLGVPAWAPDGGSRVLLPRQCPMISFPYEHSFSQLKDAALVTLRAQREALARGMSLKDASAYNVQFVDGKPTLIDTLSFERNVPGPWMAYRQFCQHFYAPLALVARVDASFGKVAQVFIDGLPLLAASRALPLRTWFSTGPLMHLHLHARAESRLGRRAAPPTATSRVLKPQLVDSLEAGVRRMRWRPRSAWTDYYGRRESYTVEALEQKHALVASWLDAAKPARVWDLGANTGRFSRLASERGIFTVAFDQDPACVEAIYLEARRRNDRHLLPLVVDLANPSPAIGWAHAERASLMQRGPTDAVFAFALLHHLAIGNNVPFDRLAGFLASVSRHLFIEFVPKSDPMVAHLLRSRADIFGEYTEGAFEAAFTRNFRLERRERLDRSERTLYWFHRP
jgi:hypothetical protein